MKNFKIHITNLLLLILFFLVGFQFFQLNKMEKTQGANDIVGKIPSYFSKQLNCAISKINKDYNSNKKAGTYGIDIESFIFITDVHWNTNKKYSPSLIKKIMENTAVQTVICGGDAIIAHNPTKHGAVKELKGFINAIRNIPCYEFYYVFGNHDDNTNGNKNAAIQFTREELYNILYLPFAYLKNVHWIWEDDPSVLKETIVKADYYVDHPRTRTRYLCLDWTNPVSNRRIKWIHKVLSKNDGYRIIVFYHGIYSGMGGKLTKEHIQIMDALFPFRNKIVALFSGHAHQDSVQDYYGDGSVPVIITACDTFRPSYMKENTLDEQCFDVAIVDYKQNKIKLTRIGRGKDREIPFSLSK